MWKRPPDFRERLIPALIAHYAKRFLERKGKRYKVTSVEENEDVWGKAAVLCCKLEAHPVAFIDAAFAVFWRRKCPYPYALGTRKGVEWWLNRDTSFWPTEFGPNKTIQTLCEENLHSIWPKIQFRMFMGQTLSDAMHEFLGDPRLRLWHFFRVCLSYPYFMDVVMEHLKETQDYFNHNPELIPEAVKLFPRFHEVMSLLPNEPM